jgi:hypothetical protein
MDRLADFTELAAKHPVPFLVCGLYLVCMASMAAFFWRVNARGASAQEKANDARNGFPEPEPERAIIDGVEYVGREAIDKKLDEIWRPRRW